MNAERSDISLRVGAATVFSTNAWSPSLANMANDDKSSRLLVDGLKRKQWANLSRSLKDMAPAW
jgi:hypothetical protein